MDSEHEKVAIFDNKVKKNAKLVFNSYPDCSKDVELTLLSSEIGEYKFQDRDFYAALLGLRVLLEPENIVICVNGCRSDFVCSSMAQQMSKGRVGYIVEMGKRGTNKARTFDYCDDESKLATVDFQMNYIRKWRESL